MPGAAVCISPWGDMTCSHASYRTRDDADPIVKHAGITQMAALYLNGADPRDPLASPNFADLTGLPPMLIHVGSAETLHDDAFALEDGAAWLTGDRDTGQLTLHLVAPNLDYRAVTIE